jgi:mannose-6-phosphate isomerase-like protein (cupin superfamily)
MPRTSLQQRIDPVRIALLVLLLAVGASTAHAQLPAVDVSAQQIDEFIDALPRDAISDRPIRVIDAGSHRVAVYGVFRPGSLGGDAILHEVSNSEIYYMLSGAGTLVTGGELIEPFRSEGSSTSVRGHGIEGGVSRRVVPGDVVVIPGGVPHWWQELEGDIEYLIFRPDAENRIPLR